MNDGHTYACSVIVTTDSLPELLGRAIMSIEEQACVPARSVEILVFGNPANTIVPATTRELKSQCTRQRLRFIPDASERKPGAVVSHILRQAKGEYIAYCDAGDYWFPHHLATALQVLRNDPSVDMAINGWALEQLTIQPDGGLHRRFLLPPHPVEFACSSCHVHRRESVQDLPEFDPRVPGQAANLFDRIRSRGSFVRTGAVGVVNAFVEGLDDRSREYMDGIPAVFY